MDPFRWLRRWFISDDVLEQLRDPRPAPRDEGVPVKQTDAGKRWTLIAQDICPHCKKHGAQFYAGPRGGMSQNIQCENCGWWFNVTPAICIAEDIGFKSREDDKLGGMNGSQRPH